MSKLQQKYYCFKYSEFIAVEYVNLTDTVRGFADMFFKVNNLSFVEQYSCAHVHDDDTKSQTHEKMLKLHAHTHEFDMQSS